MGLYTGQDAYVNNVPATTSWSASKKAAVTRYTNSGAAGGSVVSTGALSWEGQMTGHGAQPPLFPSKTAFTFRGVIDNTIAAKKDLAGSIFISELTININKAAQTPIEWTAAWASNGAMTLGTTGGADATTTEPEYGSDLAIDLGDEGDPTAADSLSSCLQSAQLVFRRELKEVVCGGVVQRRPGNLECDVSFVVSDEAFELSDFALNAKKLIQIFVSPTTSWRIHWLRFVDQTGFTVSNVTQDFIGQTFTANWTALDGTDQGTIIGPDDTIYYP